MKKPNHKKKKKGTRKRVSSSGANVQTASAEALDNGGKEESQKAVSISIARKEPEKKREKKDSVFKYFKIAGQFLREAKMELKKVKWPTRKELLASTAVVIVLVLVMALFLGLIDFGLIKIIKNIVG